MRVDPSWPYLGVLTLGAMLVALVPCSQWASSETVEVSELAKVMFFAQLGLQRHDQRQVIYAAR
jgi:hypothetical protein